MQTKSFVCILKKHTFFFERKKKNDWKFFYENDVCVLIVCCTTYLIFQLQCGSKQEFRTTRLVLICIIGWMTSTNNNFLEWFFKRCFYFHYTYIVRRLFFVLLHYLQPKKARLKVAFDFQNSIRNLHLIFALFNGFATHKKLTGHFAQTRGREPKGICTYIRTHGAL